MKRRAFMAGTAAIALARPAISAATKPLLFVPQSNLTSLDPVWTAATVTRNFAMMVYETLYARDINYTPQPFMVEGHVIEDDGKRWTMRLREGLQFHDGTPVLARDCVASLQRWLKRDPGATVFAPRVAAFEAADDRTLVWRLHKPFPTLPAFLSKAQPQPVIVPARLAATDPYKQLTEIVGSGPFRFLPDEYVSGGHAGFARFDRYKPRQEPASYAAGGHRVMVDRVEWKIIPDAATSASALTAGEVARPDRDAEAPGRGDHGFAGYLWHIWAFAAEPHPGADQQPGGAACHGGGDQPEGRDDRDNGRGPVDVASAGGLFRAQFEKRQ